MTNLPEHTPLNTFTCSGKLRATDPCYDKRVWCTIVLDVLPGTYRATCLRRPFHDWGNRVWELAVVHEGFAPSDLTWEAAEGEAGVDSGQCGFYDDAQYPDDPGDYGEDGFYDRVCEDTLRGDAARRAYGVFTSSGLGDGGYTVMFGKNADGIIAGALLVFLNDDDRGGMEPFFKP
ncbi:MAG TPA: hypothetical protein VIY27_05070 [Myxococcota bacterium]